MPDDAKPYLLTVKKAAYLLSMSKPQIRALMADGKLIGWSLDPNKKGLRVTYKSVMEIFEKNIITLETLLR